MPADSSLDESLHEFGLHEPGRPTVRASVLPSSAAVSARMPASHPPKSRGEPDGRAGNAGGLWWSRPDRHARGVRQALGGAPEGWRSGAMGYRDVRRLATWGAARGRRRGHRPGGGCDPRPLGLGSEGRPNRHEEPQAAKGPDPGGAARLSGRAPARGRTRRYSRSRCTSAATHSPRL